MPAAASVLTSPPADVRAIFDAPLASTQVQPNWLRVLVAGSGLAGTVAVDGSNPRALVFTPSSALPTGVEIGVDVDSSVTGADGRPLGIGSSWAFTITTPAATQIQVSPVITLQGGLTNPELLPLLRTRPGEIAAAFTNNGFESVAFWSESSGACSDLASTVIAGFDDPILATDGVGGLLAQRHFGVVHHQRSLTSTASNVLVNGRRPMHMGDPRRRQWRHARHPAADGNRSDPRHDRIPAKHGLG